MLRLQQHRDCRQRRPVHCLHHHLLRRILVHLRGNLRQRVVPGGGERRERGREERRGKSRYLLTAGCPRTQVDYGDATPAAAPVPASPAVSCSSSLSCLISYAAMDLDGTNFPAISTYTAGTGKHAHVQWLVMSTMLRHACLTRTLAAPSPPTADLFSTYPFSRFIRAAMSLSNKAICDLAVKGSSLNDWSVTVRCCNIPHRTSRGASRMQASRFGGRAAPPSDAAPRCLCMQNMAPSWAQGFLNTVTVTGYAEVAVRLHGDERKG